MNVASCSSNATGFRAERALAGALLGAAIVAACSQPPPTAADLQLPLARAAGFAAIEPRFAMTDDPAAGAPARALEQMRHARVTSAAEALYRSAPPGTGAIKLRIELFVDEAAAQANWQTRHRPEALAMTTAFDAGDAAWMYREEMAGMRVGRAIFEFRVKGGARGLPELVRAQADFARSRLGR
jgi:hypothetical protein